MDHMLKNILLYLRTSCSSHISCKYVTYLSIPGTDLSKLKHGGHVVPGDRCKIFTAAIWPFSKIIHDWWWWLNVAPNYIDTMNKHFGNPPQFKWIESGDSRKKKKFITSEMLHMCWPGAAETPSNAVADWLMPSRWPITCALANRLEKRPGTAKITSPIILIQGKIPTHAFSRIQDKINGIPEYFPVGNHKW